MIILTDEIREQIKQHLKDIKDDDIFKEINTNPIEKHIENIKKEPKRELQKLTDEQKKKIMDVLNDFSSIYFADESPESEYITEYDILMKQKEKEWKSHFLEDNTPSSIEALLEVCDEYMENKKNPKSIGSFAVDFSFIVNYDMWLNKSAVWPVMHNPEWEKWEKLKEIKVKRGEHSQTKQLYSGIFWILSDCYDLSDYKLLMFGIPCDSNGNPDNTHSIELNSKSGKSYNHKKLWETEVKNNNNHRPYNKKDYNYYPRGRVEISHNRAAIYLNPNINKPNIIDEIKKEFGLYSYNISEVRVNVDGSVHYQCFWDWN